MRKVRITDDIGKQHIALKSGCVTGTGAFYILRIAGFSINHSIRFTIEVDKISRLCARV